MVDLSVCVCVCACVSVAYFRKPWKMAELIEMPFFRGANYRGPKEPCIITWGRDPQAEWAISGVTRPIEIEKHQSVIPRTPTAGVGDPLLHPPASRPVAGRGAQASRCWDKRPGVGTQTLVPPTFQPWLRPCFDRMVGP